VLHRQSHAAWTRELLSLEDSQYLLPKDANSTSVRCRLCWLVFLRVSHGLSASQEISGKCPAAFATNAGTLVSVLAFGSHLVLVSFDRACRIPARSIVTPHSQHYYGKIDTLSTISFKDVLQ
jgi:hypothetical protein